MLIQRRQPITGLAERPLASHAVLQRIYRQRGVTDVAELDYQFSRLPPPQSMRGMTEAVALLEHALCVQQRILVVGDFDADGATSTAVAVRGLRLLGARQVDFLVPNRFAYGYGLTPEIVALAREKQPDLLVTVDNGIASLDGVALAQQWGMRVLVTDHHLPGARLPTADAIVNPNQPSCTFQDKSLAGVGVMFYVLLALRAQLRSVGWFVEQQIAEPNLANLLDLVALGTVADVVPLSPLNRILVHQGLLRIRARQCCVGIQALAAVAKRELSRVVANDLGFHLAPRLNAAGRLNDMRDGIQCLLTDDASVAGLLATELDTLNRERRLIEADMHSTAMTDPVLQYWASMDAALLPRSLCLYNSGWHQGVIGILASRLRERFHRPAIVFADANEDEIKGSARSISGLHIRDALDHIASTNPHVLSRFGGHAMAAGLTIRREYFDDFLVLFEQEVQCWLDDSDLQAVLLSDGELTAAELNLELAELLRNAGPWGQRFPEPLFDGVFVVQHQKLVSEKHLRLRLSLPSQDGTALDAIAFGVDTAQWPAPDVRQVRIAYSLDVNEYNGLRKVQLLVRHIEAWN